MCPPLPEHWFPACSLASRGLLSRQLVPCAAATGGRVGVDPFVHTIDNARLLQRKLEVGRSDDVFGAVSDVKVESFR